MYPPRGFPRTAPEAEPCAPVQGFWTLRSFDFQAVRAWARCVGRGTAMQPGAVGYMESGFAVGWDGRGLGMHTYEQHQYSLGDQLYLY